MNKENAETSETLEVDMCEIKLSSQAVKTLKELGCNKHNFLRLYVTNAEKHETNALIDSCLNPTDEVILDHNNLRIVSAASDSSYFDGSQIEFSPCFRIFK